MGLTKVTAKLCDLAKKNPPFEAVFLVDTGSIDCLAGSDVLVATGIQPEGKDSYELANGEPVEYQYGYARLSFMGADTVVKIIFGPPNSEPLLGAVALEVAGMTVDPVTRTLKRLPTRSLK
ncbi:MAG: clan AA aspartic protease [Planctomycetota bacterium]